MEKGDKIMAVGVVGNGFTPFMTPILNDPDIILIPIEDIKESNLVLKLTPPPISELLSWPMSGKEARRNRRKKERKNKR